MENGRIKRRLPASQRKSLILDAAIRTFVEFGYHGALMETIAERADVTKPILYRHFPSKMSLFLAILDQACKELRNSLLEPLGGEADWKAAIAHDVRSYLDFVENYGMTYRLIYATDLNVDQEVSERLTRIRNDIIAIVADRIRAFADTGEMPNQEVGITAVMLVGMIETTVMHWMNNQETPLSTYEDNLVRGATSILAALPPRKR